MINVTHWIPLASSSLLVSSMLLAPGLVAETPVSLQTYDETAKGIPVTAQYPKTMEVFSTGSSEGVGVFFTFKPQAAPMDRAEVHVFLPSGTSTVAELEPFVTGSGGLIENNGWIIGGVDNAEVFPYSEEFPYSWVERVVNFKTDMEELGLILLGQTDGQAVQGTLLYPSAMADAYWSDAKTVLDSLEFNAELLPISQSSQGE